MITISFFLNTKLKYLPYGIRNNLVNCNGSKELSSAFSVQFICKKTHNCIKLKDIMLIKNHEKECTLQCSKILT